MVSFPTPKCVRMCPNVNFKEDGARNMQDSCVPASVASAISFEGFNVPSLHTSSCLSWSRLRKIWWIKLSTNCSFVISPSSNWARDTLIALATPKEPAWRSYCNTRTVHARVTCLSCPNEQLGRLQRWQFVPQGLFHWEGGPT
jgi:hypothetical protein